MDIIIDCFAGGGGASVGIEMALGRSVDIAINHDPEAIRMHKVNHPNTQHLTEDIFKVDLQRYVKGRHVALMWASPDCTSHSKAKGGQPRSKGLRILPWAVYKHAKTLLPDVIIMENVEEIQQWGPLDANGKPIKERAGEDYQKFITAMQSIGYDFQSRELVAADYGAPTTRKRWYAIFRRDGKPILWPEQTHSKIGESFPKWKECGDYIDWSDLGKSIFDRKKPLAEATMKRIANGVKKYIIDNSHPYIVLRDAWMYSSFWYKNFDSMAYKTMLRHLLSKWGPMSTELQQAFSSDMTFENADGSRNYVETEEDVIDIDPSEPVQSEQEQQNESEQAAEPAQDVASALFGNQ